MEIEQAFINRYCNSSLSTPELLSGIDPGESASLRALESLQECLEGRRLAKDAIRAAKSVPIDETPAPLFVLILANWAELSCKIGQQAEAMALIHRSDSLLSDETPPEIRAALFAAQGTVAGARGYHTQKAELLKAAVDVCDTDSPRRREFLFRYAALLASRGSLSALEKSAGQGAKGALLGLDRQQFSITRLLNAVEVSDRSEAQKLFDELGTDPQELSCFPGLRPAYRNAITALKLISAPRTQIADLAVDVQELPANTLWTIVCRCLSERLTDDALYWARHAESKNAETVVSQGISSYSLIRAELSAGNGEAARRLLDLRRSRGNTHYLDSFFYARVESLANNASKAHEHFQLALKSAEHHNANGRFDFELDLACELKPGQLMQLTRPAPEPAHTPTTVKGSSLSDARFGADRILGPSPLTEEVRRTATRFASLDVPVFITGDTGTGKELIARALHEAGDRKQHEFIPINCGAIVDSLLESELFGHSKGAFTGAVREHIGFFEQAGEGTIFLDEIGDISARLQVALLRVLEAGEIRPIGSTETRHIRCRIVAATNADLEQRVKAGEFRDDLLFRLRRLEISVPTLKARRPDILPLTRHFLDIGRQQDVHANVSQELENALQLYDWPGNIRELRNVIEKMRLLHSDKLEYGVDDLDPKFREFVRQVKRTHTSTSRGARPSTVTRRKPGTGTSLAPTERFTRHSSLVSDVIGKNRTAFRRLERLRALFTEHGRFTRAEIIQILGISPNTATRDLKELCNEGFVEKVMPTASARSHYFEVKTQ